MTAARLQGPWVLVLDVGSSSVRAWLFDADGDGVDPGPEAQRPYAWRARPAGAMEQEAAPILEAVVAAVDAALEHARAAGLAIAAVATTTLWHSLLGVGGAGEPLTPVYAWGDVRAAPDALALRAEVEEREVHRRTGCFLHPSYPSVKLLWLRRTAPERFRAVAGWISVAEYLEQRLFGTRRASLSMASGSGLLDLHRLRWDPWWLERAGIAESQLSPLVDAGEAQRGLRPEWAARWPELADVPWFPALGDGACANVGSGAVGRGALALTIGTSAAVRTLWEAETAEVPEGLWCYRLDRRRWVAGRALSNGGNGVAYLRGLLALPPQREWDAAVARLGPDSHGLTVLPYLVGERGPGWLHETRASVVGLTGATPPEHLLRAWLEAVAYRIAGGCALLEEWLGPVRRVHASGGALHGSASWPQILADVLHRPVHVPMEPEATSRGAALVALERLGTIPDLAAVPTRMAAAFEPDAARHAVYRGAMARQAALEAALRPWQDQFLAPPGPPGGA